MYATIGEHHILFIMDSQEIRSSIADTFHAKETGKLKSYLHVDMQIKIEGNYGKPFSGYEVCTNAEDGQIQFKRTDYSIIVNPTYETAEVKVYDDFALKHAILQLYSSFIIYRRWGLLLNSSCVAERNNAFIFAGLSSFGKTALSKISRPRLVLSDEATLICVRSGGDITVFDSPFRREERSEHLVRHCKLHSIHILQSSFKTESIHLKESDALLHIANHLTCWPHNKAESGKALSMCRQLVQHIPVSIRYYENNESLWESIV
ncbi:hypothetical protein [Paenibacillus thalictri]|uniref:Uncharacterized protein n=1 Tax=Paenibacillus thalictri TaxID=2527873 RepID=A0A4V6MSD2_9BACL|nr:hypothetical protein [Paenibacillus thalictri]TBL70852.1 hypothetical protein EYB31_31910 [Paenibacillus thalictri]